MSSIARDLSGMRFSRWTVLSRASVGVKAPKWNCVCECGNKRAVDGYTLRKGISQSCGCMPAEKGAKFLTKHGNCYHPLYNTWDMMRRRCSDPNATGYDRYGGRGITVCEKWKHDFSTFVADMGRKPSPEHTIDRINNDGNYEPENCRWATPEEQRENKRPRKKKTHCKSGHEFTAENTRYAPDGSRICYTCKSRNLRAYKARVKSIFEVRT